MKITTAALVLTGALLLSGGRAEAQTVALAGPSAPSVAADSIEAANRMQLAESHLAAGRTRDARRVLETLAEEQRASAVVPADALLRLASIHAAEGKYARAAFVLDELSEIADAYGDPATQTRALLEAAVLYGNAGMGEVAALRVARLQELVNSPFVTDAFRDEVGRRLFTR